MRTVKIDPSKKNALDWNQALTRDDYIIVSYRIETPLDLEIATYLLAEEQSLPVNPSRNLNLPSIPNDRS